MGEERLESFKIKAEEDKENPPEIPPLPNKKGDLIKLSRKRFEVEARGSPDLNLTFKSGAISTFLEGVRCPFCATRFIRKVTCGYLNITREPFLCPNCDFPTNVYKVRDALLKKSNLNL